MTNNTNEAANSQVDMIDFDLDELESLPEFETLPAGTYLMEGVALSQPSSEKFGRQVRVAVKVLQTVELAHPETDKPVADGSVHSWDAPLSNPDDLFWIKASQDNVKKITGAIGSMYGTKSFLALVEKYPGTQFGAVITNRSYKDSAGETRKTANIKAVIVE